MSEWIAVECLDEAVARTKGLLLPFSLGLWLRLAAVVVLAGGVGGAGRGDFSFGGDEFMQEPGALGVLAAIIAILAFVGLVLFYVSCVFGFVWVESAVKGDAKVAEYFAEQADRGLKLFLFELIVLAVLLAAIVVAGVGAAALAYSLQSEALMIVFVVVGLFAVIGAAVAFAVLFWALTDVVVPIMYASGCGVLPGIGRAWDLIGRQFWQFAVYGLMRVALGLAAGIAVVLVSLPFAMVAAFFLVALGVGGYLGNLALGGGLSPASLAVLAALLSASAAVRLVVAYVVSFLTLPVSAFFMYYNLIFLQRADPTLALLAPKGAAGGQSAAPDGQVKVY
jgi:hypothetical protein